MRGFGIGPTTAAEQLQKAWPPHVGTQPLPKGIGGQIFPHRLGIADNGIANPLTFFVLGDHGGVKDAGPQNAVSEAMQAHRAKLTDPLHFVYSLGDVVYFNGDASEYHPQFYEAYAHLDVPFVAIPGNHDGDTSDDIHRQPLDTFMANFCASTPAPPVGSEEYGRDTQIQPYCDWTLAHPDVTIIGLYTNVPSGGHLEPLQVDWLARELKAARTDAPIILTMHHPPYSIDAHHGGSQKMGAAIDTAGTAAGRWPALVLSGHVHDYQRFTRPGSGVRPPITYVVSGNGGYHNLHKLAPGARIGQALAPGIVYEAGDDTRWGFLKLTISAGRIKGEAVAVPLAGATSTCDNFEV